MGLAGFLRKLQDIYTKHKLISTFFLVLLLIPPSYFYGFYATGHLFNVFLTNNSEDTNNFVGATFHYITVIAQAEGFAVLGISMFSLLSPLLNVLASPQKIDPDVELSFKSLVLSVTEPARSLLVTWFFVRLFKLGYIFLGVLVFHKHLTLFINSSCHQQPELSALLPGIGTIIFVAGGVLIFAYLATFGNLALEISVREGVRGTEALEKASQVLEGKRKVIGFLVNLVLAVISVGLFAGYVYLNTCSKLSGDSKKSNMINLWYNGIYQVEFYTWVFFSIFYSMYKKSRGEITFQPQGSLKRILQEELPLVTSSASSNRMN